MDYKYLFNEASTNYVPITILDNNLTIPNNITSYDTVLLKLHIKEKLLKNPVLPYLALKTDNTKVTHYLERNNTGIRYFNLTDVIKNNSEQQKIKLSSNKLKWKNEAELLFFNNNIPASPKVLVISPHPDDAELASFGFYSQHNSTIVTITSGERGKNFYHDFCSENLNKSSLLKAKLRIHDSITTPLFGNVGINNAINLCYFDEIIKQMHDNPNQAISSSQTNITDINILRKYNKSNLLLKTDGKATWKNLVNDLEHIIRQTQPDLIITPHPILDKHNDHKYSTIAVFAAIEKCGLKKGKFLFYINHSLFSARYPYGPKHTPITLPPCFENINMKHSVYSHSLTIEKQIEKTFALDMMHDLRAIPDQPCTLKNALQKKMAKKFYHCNAWHDYYRKAIRSNELFLVSELDFCDLP